ncbi:LPP20 family lipoprotein [Planctobacterium marinum]|uniref:LPP20 family lipoprotein n=1 Tax=Planctobacterium marinum TaxID=1631968 RepID=UPI001E31C21E|nr:LPP20 family lipoprotein [Planctobacterium marinum]MCC2606290.1 LPP20 family lipoprotein [Planctobacterium marinum]
MISKFVNRIDKALIVSVLALSVSGCKTLESMYYSDKQVEWEYVQPEEYPVLTAVGYAPISSQMGNNDSVKMLMAIKASKLDAYKELAEQVYGQRIDTEQSLANLVLRDNELKASVEGVIRGAQVIKSYPVGEDVYATELSLDFQKVYDIYLSTARPRKVKDVVYY